MIKLKNSICTELCRSTMHVNSPSMSQYGGFVSHIDAVDGVKPCPRLKKALGYEGVAKPCAKPRENCCSGCPVPRLIIAPTKRVPG